LAVDFVAQLNSRIFLLPPFSDTMVMMLVSPVKTVVNQDPLLQTKLIDERFAASYFGVSVETLRTWRKQDRGPRFRRIGRCIRYSTADLLAFVETAPSGGGRNAVTGAARCP